MNSTVPTEAVKVVAGFSVTNRWILYTSMMLAPAQFVSDVGSNCPSNLGFLAYNMYTQVQWYQAVRGRQLHALSLLPVNFNFFYSLTYLGGVSSGTYIMAVFLALGTAAAMIQNTVSAWKAWSTYQPDGFGVYQFFFCGWRTLSPGWHRFIMLWQISDSSLLPINVVAVFIIALYAPRESFKKKFKWWHRYVAIPVGAMVMMLVCGLLSCGSSLLYTGTIFSPIPT